jgi:hypothetical protein
MQRIEQALQLDLRFAEALVAVGFRQLAKAAQSPQQVGDVVQLIV